MYLLLIQISQRFSYNIKFIVSSTVWQTVACRTLQLRTSIESLIREKLINCENFSLCLDESTDMNDFIFYLSYKHGLILSQR